MSIIVDWPQKSDMQIHTVFFFPQGQIILLQYIMGNPVTHDFVSHWQHNHNMNDDDNNHKKKNNDDNNNGNIHDIIIHNY